MTTPPGPTPPAVDTQTLTGVVTAVQTDPPALAAGIRGRITASHEEGNVCMMGGWTS
ncbi:hypothetical protein ABZ281_07820 [Streptomyces sp. NPDC006265]|uniref:hypothetical protein n=1 Tax=Streptomyces sp. NPDC006265 TaxID=3156740 RepID=UPI0033BCF0DD